MNLEDRLTRYIAHCESVVILRSGVALLGSTARSAGYSQKWSAMDALSG